MASNNRAAQINKVLKVAKKHFKPADIPADRTVLEHLILACCAENSLLNLANDVFTTLASDYYDWNEVRVTSIRELTEVMKPLNDPKESATRLKRVLQSVFETHYTFDLEPLKKQNIGQTVKQFEKYNGTTHFTVAFVTQNALGGHSIPINAGLLKSMRVVGVISDSEASKGTVPGLERAVPKSKGAEVGTILHQLGVELHRSPYGPTIRKLLLEIDPQCKERLPKRPSKKIEKPVKEKAVEKPKEKPKPKPEKAKPASKGSKAKSADKPSSKGSVKTATSSKKKVVKKAVTKSPAAKKSGGKKPAPKAAKAKKKVATKKSAKKQVTTKKTTKKKAAAKKTTTKKKGTKASAAGKKKKSVTKKLTKRKPK